MREQTRARLVQAARKLFARVEAGRLSVPDERVALHGAGGPLLGVMRAVLDGDAPDDVDIHHAEGVLRLLGLTATDAAEVARRPLPPLDPGAWERRTTL